MRRAQAEEQDLSAPGDRRPGQACPELLTGLAAERARITDAVRELDAVRGLLDAIMVRCGARVS
ncbi:hypothetical protein [Kitasatospora sp. NPDC050463]|uniref:hypothetical protein n=1 Tax=Kitasatospora sp. NPDC050463 TaxID=3155786 RepID=UPI0033E97226